jgi:hypothetical protein
MTSELSKQNIREWIESGFSLEVINVIKNTKMFRSLPVAPNISNRDTISNTILPVRLDTYANNTRVYHAHNLK